MYNIDTYHAPKSDIVEKVIHANKMRISTYGWICAVDSLSSRTLGLYHHICMLALLLQFWVANLLPCWGDPDT